jgi:hypothetical protein
MVRQGKNYFLASIFGLRTQKSRNLTALAVFLDWSATRSGPLGACQGLDFPWFSVATLAGDDPRSLWLEMPWPVGNRRISPPA